MKKRTLATLISTLIFTTIIPVSPASAYSYEEMRNMTESSYDLIKLSAARDLGLTGKDQVVVFIDDGIEIDHPYIKNNVLDGFCSSAIACGSLHLKSGKEAGGIFPKTSSSGHGNMVAGIIAGEVNSVALGGIAPSAKLISITNTDGNFPGLEAAFNWILEAKKRYNIVAVSGSFGSVNLGTRSDFLSCTDSELNEKIKALSDAGIVPVFSAGNESNVLRMSHPACLPFVVSVGALSYKGLLQDYSNVGGSLTVLAPSDVMTASRNGGYGLGGGTSAAGPVVAGVVALLKQAKPSATVQEIKSALQSSDKYLNDAYWTGLPVLNISSALAALKTGDFIKPPVIAQSDEEKRIGVFRKDAEEARKAQVKAELELGITKAAAEAEIKLLKNSAEAEIKLAKTSAEEEKMRANGMLLRDLSCSRLPSISGMQGEVQQKQTDGTWRTVSTLVGFSKSETCPIDFPVYYWATIEASDGSTVRWRFFDAGGSNNYGNEIIWRSGNPAVSQLQEKAVAEVKLAREAQVKSETDARLAMEAKAKAETDFKNSQILLTQIQKENASLKKKLSAICKIKPKPKGC